MDIHELSYLEVIGRLLAAIAAGGIVGYEREKKGRDAGFRTHIMVAVGACILALVQMEMSERILLLASRSDIAKAVLNADSTRLIAQIVSGIGFLGAGTIIVTQNHVSGLTTAASIWTVAALGIAIGVGFYAIATAGIIAVLVTLLLVKRIFRFPNMRILTLKYVGDKNINDAIRAYFHENHIRLMKSNETVLLRENLLHHVYEYRIDMKVMKHDHDLLTDIAALGHFDTLQITDPKDEL